MMSINSKIEIDGRPIGLRYPPYIVAELSGNHNGDINRALRLMELAKEAGAHAVKLQTYTPDTMTIDCNAEIFQIKGGLWNGRQLYDLYGEAQTPWEWHTALFAKGKELDLTVFSTPFDHSAVDFLHDLGAPAYKVASFEVIDLPLIRHIAEKGKPIIISTGMADLGEISEAVETAKTYGNGELILLHCVSAYPTPPEETNLTTLPHLAETFDTVAGLSDHTLGISVPIASIALGATIIEKHVTIRRADGGPDADFSLEPEELAELVSTTRTAWEALGNIDYTRKPSEQQNMVFRRSLIVVQDITKGEKFSAKNIRCIRPGQGLAPKYFPEIIGRVATQDIKRGAPLDWMMVR